MPTSLQQPSSSGGIRLAYLTFQLALIATTIVTIFSTYGFAQRASAEPPTVYIVLHERVSDDEIVAALKCMLNNTFTVHFDVISGNKLNYGSAYDRPSHNQYRVSEIRRKIIDERIRGTIPNGLIFYVIADDMYDWIPAWDRNANFLFSQFHRSTKIGLISLARIGAGDAETVAERLYKIIVPFTALSFGHRPSGRCFMTFSRSLSALDSRPPYLCEPDLTHLKQLNLIHPGLKEDSELKTCHFVS